MKAKSLIRRATSALAAVCTCILGAQPHAAGAQELVTASVDASDRVSLVGNVHPLARAEFDRGAAPDSLPAERMLLVLRSSPEQETALKRLLSQQKNSASPNYRHWLTPEEFGERFGASSEDLAKVSDWLLTNGFRVDRVAPGRRIIEFSGTAGQVRTAFGTPIHKYLVNGKQHWANTRDPQIPRALSTVVVGVRSLHNFESKAANHLAGVFKRNPTSGKIEAVKQMAPSFTLAGGDLWAVGPTDLATIYNVAPVWGDGTDGTGQTIAIVQRTNINPQDVADFRSLFGLPASAPVITLTQAPDPGITPDETEALIDVDWAGAVAKGATINLIVSASTNTTDGVDLSADYAVQHNVAPIMSTSFGLCELFLGNAGNAFWASEWQQAAAQGITSFVSAGDNGPAGCDDPSSTAAVYGFQVNGLASTPYNVAVGGTDFLGNFQNPDAYWSPTNDPTTKASALSYIPETPWNDTCASSLFLGDVVSNCNNPNLGGAPPFSFMNLIAGSGGKSTCTIARGSFLPGSCFSGYPKPPWQVAPGVPIVGPRLVPDVSLFSGDGFLGSFYVVCQADMLSGPCDLDSGQFVGLGGTSVASPAFAGIMALVNQKTAAIQGNANYDFYRLANTQVLGSCNSTRGSASACIFNDVVSGGTMVPCVVPSLNCLGNGAQGAGVLQVYKAVKGYDRASGLGSVNVANLVDNWPVSTAAFGSATYTVSEMAGLARIDVNRVGSALAPLYVSWAVTGGTGVVGKEFGSAIGNFTIAAGATTGSLVFPVLHDYTVGDRTVDLALFPAPGGTPSTATLTITNVDQPGSIQFLDMSTSARTRTTGATTINLTVQRTAGAAKNVTVDFTTTDGTAVTGTDYEVVTSPNTLTFGTRQLAQHIVIKVFKQPHASDPTFTVTLSNPGSGAILGGKTTETVTILEK